VVSFCSRSGRVCVAPVFPVLIYNFAGYILRMSLKIFAEIMRLPGGKSVERYITGEEFHYIFSNAFQGGDAAQEYLTLGGEVLVLARDKHLRR